MRQANFAISILGLALWGQILGLLLATAAQAEEDYVSPSAALAKFDLKKPEQRRFAEGWKLYVQGSWDRAEASFKAGLKSFPKYYLFEYGLACVNYRKGKYEAALDQIDEAIVRNPKFGPAMRMKGCILSARGNYPEAVEEFNIVIFFAPATDIEDYRLRGMAYLESGQLQKAKADLAAGRKLNPNDRSMHVLSAAIACEEARYQDALKDCAVALEKNKDDAQVYALRSRVYAELFDFAGARKDLAAAGDLTKRSWQYEFRQLSDLEYDHVNAESEPGRLWLLACGAPLALQNNEGLCSLSGVVRNKENIDSEAKMLKEMWGISSREELIDTVRGLRNGGHNALWLSDWNIYKSENRDGAYRKAQAALKGQARERAELVARYGYQFGERGILGWELGRTISLCRWGYRLGFLSKREAFSMMVEPARLIQQNYGSWKQYLDEYYVGRRFWNAEVYLDEKNSVERKLRHQFMDAQSPFNKLSWTAYLDQKAIEEAADKPEIPPKEN